MDGKKMLYPFIMYDNNNYKIILQSYWTISEFIFIIDVVEKKCTLQIPTYFKIPYILITYFWNPLFFYMEGIILEVVPYT